MEIIFLSTGGGPGDLTQFTAVYLYQKAFVASQYGYGQRPFHPVRHRGRRTDTAGPEAVPHRRGGLVNNPALSSKKAKNVLLGVFLSVLAFLQLFPLLWVFNYSIQKTGDPLRLGVLQPSRVSAVEQLREGLRRRQDSTVVDQQPHHRGQRRALTTVFSFCIAYACTRMSWKLRKWVLGFVSLGLVIPHPRHPAAELHLVRTVRSHRHPPQPHHSLRGVPDQLQHPGHRGAAAERSPGHGGVGVHGRRPVPDHPAPHHRAPWWPRPSSPP